MGSKTITYDLPMAFPVTPFRREEIRERSLLVVEVRALDGMQKEAIVQVPKAGAWRMVCDEATIAIGVHKCFCHVAHGWLYF